MPSNFTLTNQLNIGFQVDFYHDTPTEKPNFQPIRQSKIQRERMQKQFNYQAIFINKNLSRWLSVVLFDKGERREKNILPGMLQKCNIAPHGVIFQSDFQSYFKTPVCGASFS